PIPRLRPNVRKGRRPEVGHAAGFGRSRRSNDRCCELLTGRLWPILLKNSNTEFSACFSGSV
ncbi:MAG: hypothetical protein WCB21_11975, partial [Azonexus sp.]